VLHHPLRVPQRPALDHPIALRFQFSRLLTDQVEAIEQPLDVRPGVWRKGLAKGGAELPSRSRQSRLSGLYSPAPRTVSAASIRVTRAARLRISSSRSRIEQWASPTGIPHGFVRDGHPEADSRLASQPGEQSA